MAVAKLSSGIHYTQRSLVRADRAVRCSPFRLRFYEAIVTRSVPLKAITGSAGLRSGFTKQAVTELRAENELLWLIQVGLLRREVDGQGLTDSFRITPLGRQLLHGWQNVGETALRASLWERLQNTLSRWIRLPI